MKQNVIIVQWNYFGNNKSNDLYTRKTIFIPEIPIAVFFFFKDKLPDINLCAVIRNNLLYLNFVFNLVHCILKDLLSLRCVYKKMVFNSAK
jgi:hypothetical protein